MLGETVAVVTQDASEQICCSEVNSYNGSYFQFVYITWNIGLSDAKFKEESWFCVIVFNIFHEFHDYRDFDSLWQTFFQTFSF